MSGSAIRANIVAARARRACGTTVPEFRRMMVRSGGPFMRRSALCRTLGLVSVGEGWQDREYG